MAAIRPIIVSWIGASVTASETGSGTDAAPAAAADAAAMIGRAISLFHGRLSRCAMRKASLSRSGASSRVSVTRSPRPCPFPFPWRSRVEVRMTRRYGMRRCSPVAGSTGSLSQSTNACRSFATPWCPVIGFLIQSTLVSTRITGSPRASSSRIMAMSAGVSRSSAARTQYQTTEIW